MDENIICHFEDLPIREFYDWIKLFLKDWTMDEEVYEAELQSGSFEVSFEWDMQEYAKYKSIDFNVRGNKLIKLDCCNLSEYEKNEITSFANSYGLYLYEG